MILLRTRNEMRYNFLFDLNIIQLLLFYFIVLIKPVN